MGRKFKVIVGGRAKRNFGWTIPDNPYPLSESDEGVAVTYYLSNFITHSQDTTPVWQLISAPAGVTLNSTGALTKAASVAPSSYSVVISISRDSAGFEETYRGFILPVNPAVTTPEWSVSTPTAITMARNSTFNFGPYATDPAGSTLTYSLESPTPSKYSINPSTGVVTLGNSAPEFTVFHTDVYLPYSTSTQTIQFTAVDPDGDTVIYSLTQTRSGITINSTTGLVSVTSAAVGTSGRITVRASDTVDSTDIDCNVTVAAVVSGTTKWDPGHYVKTGGSFYETDQAAYLDVALGHSAKSLDVVTGATLKGSLINFAWGAINTSGTTYVKTELDRALAWHSANNKKMILQFCWKNFNTSNIKKLVPSDVAAADVVWHGAAWVAAVWRPAIMDRIIATFRWIATNYDAHPALEMVTMSESVTGIELSDPNLPADYTRAAVATQYKRLYTALSESFTKTVVCANVNSLSGEAVGLLDDGYAKGLGHATPDSHDSTGNVLFRGETKGTEIPTMDYRGLRANMQIVSDPVLQVGGKDYNGPASKVIEWSKTNKVTHLAWIPWGNTTGATWSEVKVAIGANPNLIAVNAGVSFEARSLGVMSAPTIPTSYPTLAGEYGGSFRESCTKNSRPTVVDSPVYKGNRAMKQSLPAQSAATNDLEQYRSGVEFLNCTGMKSGNYDWQGTEVWFGYALMLADNWPHPDDPTYPAEGVGYPAVGCDLHSDVTGLVGAFALRAGNGPYPNQWSVELGNEKQYPLGDLKADRGKWIRWIVNIVYHDSAAGRVKIWKNGAVVLNLSNIVTYQTQQQTPYLKCQTYNKWRLNTTTNASKACPEQTAYVDEIRWAVGASRYNDVR